ncbi:MAG: hypothetical protein IT210_02460 [Armatimonadetes bacterium]|nr:hypothetical protein [Armatimonadota bacterium]
MAIAEWIRPQSWTYGSYNALPDAAERYEIIKGELLLPPAPDIQHQDISMSLSVILGSHIREQN